MSRNLGDRFSGLAVLIDQPNGRTAILHDDLSYTTKDKWVITVPAGFETDYASIPRPLWTILPPRGKYNRPAIIHDFLYHFAPIDPTTLKRVNRGRADYIIREACENVGDRFTQRWLIYIGLKVGGWVAWKNYRDKEKAE